MQTTHRKHLYHVLVVLHIKSTFTRRTVTNVVAMYMTFFTYTSVVAHITTC